MRCSVPDCNLKAKAFIRGKEVCVKCFEVFKKDNMIRIKNKLDIPNKLVITQELSDMNSDPKFKEKYPAEKGGLYGIFQ